MPIEVVVLICNGSPTRIKNMEKLTKLIAIVITGFLLSCITWVKDEKREEFTKGLNGSIVETKNSAVICLASNVKNSIFTKYFVCPDSEKLPENTKVIERCSPGTRGKIVRFIQERDSSQHTWYYVELELNDSRLSRSYRIIRMIGLREDIETHVPWNPKDGDFRIVR